MRGHENELNEEITFLSDEIRSLKVRIAANENAVKLHKIEGMGEA